MPKIKPLQNVRTELLAMELGHQTLFTAEVLRRLILSSQADSSATVTTEILAETTVLTT